MFYVYLLKSLKDDKFYVGYTEDLKKRLSAHRDGRVPSTKSRRPLELFFYEAFLESADAKRRERYLKTTKGRATLRLMLRAGLKKLGLQSPSL